MPETNDLLTALRDVGITSPTAGDRGDDRVRSALQREITGRRRRRPVVRRPTVAVAVAFAACIVLLTTIAVGAHRARLQPSVGPARAGRPTGPGAQVRDTAYVVHQVRARLAQLVVAGRGQVLERTSLIGDGTADRPIVRNTDWAYIDPRTGVAYQRSVDRSADGTILAIDELVTAPSDNLLRTRVTFLNPVTHSYLIVHDAPPAGTVSAARSATELGIRSTAQQIDRALRHGRVTQQGIATVAGQSTIKLSVPPAPGLIGAGLPRRTTLTLYVNSRTYQPVEEVEVSPTDPRNPSPHSDTSTSRWLPTNAANIALAERRVPAGYRHASGPLHEYWTSRKPLFFIGY